MPSAFKNAFYFSEIKTTKVALHYDKNTSVKVEVAQKTMQTALVFGKSYLDNLLK